MKLAFLFLVLALLFEVTALDGFAWLCEAAYGSSRRVDASVEVPFTQAALVLAGPLALLAAIAALFLFWRRARPAVAVPLAVLTFPSLTVAVLFTHALGCVRNWW